ncbi:hypothetical protein [Synechococcus sp. PCC 7336]|uniref:hypothetical protein n=1 Tax=Synechococcus sp. PCC 7336 TaxID=195250 RepID=UPI000345203F|nr:hypothetical protein [Synechococcus sp. PCC 7336]
MRTTPRVTAQQAQAVANHFLSDRLPDRFTADLARQSDAKDVWLVPVILAYPFIGSLGKVGEILVGTSSAEIVSYTSTEKMKQVGQSIYEARQDKADLKWCIPR